MRRDDALAAAVWLAMIAAWGMIYSSRMDYDAGYAQGQRDAEARVVMPPLLVTVRAADAGQPTYAIRCEAGEDCELGVDSSGVTLGGTGWRVYRD